MTETEDYISVLSMLGIYKDIVNLLKQRLCESIELHVDTFHNPNYEDGIIEYAFEQVIEDIKPLMDDFIALLSNKHVSDVNSLDHIQYYTLITGAVGLCIEDEVENAFDHTNIPQRHYFLEYNPSLPYFHERVLNFTPSSKIEYLNSIYQPAQRTQEWYDIRNTCITASVAWKAVDSEKQRISLIKEKALALINSKNETEPVKTYSTNINSPFHWGHKYEPISVFLYEQINNTKIGEYGCIKHKDYSFIGASPDGINIDPLSYKYGTLLEIKNVVSRDITGIPKKEYWTQMQIQMEVCDLDFCDFLETKFSEYDYEEDFYNDIDESRKNTIMTNKNKEYVGFMIMFMKNNEPFYEYCPLKNTTLTLMEKWKKSTMMRVLCDNATYWVRDIYWKCVVYNCICVERNKEWFNANLNNFSQCWNEITELVSDNERSLQLLNDKNQKNNERENKRKQEYMNSMDLLDRGNIGICLIKLE